MYLKCNLISNTNIINFLIICVAINFNKTHLENYELILIKKWNHNGLLK
jgi:hypothetical protein